MKLVLNSVAMASAVNGSPKARVRVAEIGHYLELQVRPTGRASSVNLPKGELLVDINGGEIKLPEEMASGLTDGQFLVLQERNHGWLALVNAQPVGDAPGATVTA